MRIIVQIYEGELSQTTRAELIELFDEIGLELLGESGMAESGEDKFHEFRFGKPEEETEEEKE